MTMAQKEKMTSWLVRMPSRDWGGGSLFGGGGARVTFLVGLSASIGTLLRASGVGHPNGRCGENWTRSLEV
jgi:hypothetical protein